MFDIAIDDFCYKMTFDDYEIDDAIIERIQGCREPQTQAIYSALVRPGSRVLEIGSCYGEFTILISHYLGPTGALMAIEGVPNNFALLQKNLGLNDITNVTAYNFLVGNAPGDVFFKPTDKNPYNAIAQLRDASAMKHSEGAAMPVAQVSDNSLASELCP